MTELNIAIELNPELALNGKTHHEIITEGGP
jgi:hypothetical protein